MKNPTGDIREFTISEDGYLTVDGSQIDRLRVIDFPTADGMEKVGHNYYRATNPHTHEEDLEDSLKICGADAVYVLTHFLPWLCYFLTFEI